MKADAVNLDIRRHEERDVVSWKYSDTARELYKFFDLFNRRFFNGQLPTPAISFKSGRAAGWYRLGRNEFGVKDQINLNCENLGLPKYLNLMILLHEMIHQFQDYYGKHSAGWYHNKQFQTKSRELGIPSDPRWYTIQITDPFVEFCKRHGVDFPKEAEQQLKPPKRLPGRSKLRKYNCGCTNIWAATRVCARCELCVGEFKPIH